MKFFRQAVILLLCTLLTTEVLSQNYRKDSIPQPIGFVNDFENLFSVGQEKYLESMLKTYQEKTTIQIALVTIDTSMVSRGDFENYVFKIANSWGVGQKEKNNGVTIGISKGYRFMRIENGYGIEAVLTDNETKKIINSAFIPYFKKGLYYQGTITGLRAIMDKLK